MKRVLLVLSFCCTISMTAQISDYVTGLTSPVGIAKSGNTLFVTDVGVQKIQKIDMTATNPVAVDFVNNISFATKMVIIGNDMYFTTLAGTVSKVDITATNPTVVPVISALNSPFGVVVKDNFMYVSIRAYDNGGIIRFDYTQTNPTIETLITGLSGYVNDIDIYGNDLYMTRSTYGISKIDITQSNPTLVDVVAAQGVLEVKVEGDNLYYSNNYINKLDLLDENATPESIISGIGTAWDLLLDGSNILLAQQSNNKISKLNTTYVDPTTSPDYATLVSFYNNTDGDNWTSSINWLDTTKSLWSWEGVVTNENNKVVGINLYNNNLTGNLPTEIGVFDQLKAINLYSNMLTGDLPPTISNLTNLTSLTLGNNEFTGTIPSEMGNLTNLTILNLATNNFEGTLPSSFSNLTNLTSIFLDDNKFEGTLPFNASNANIYATLNNFDFSDLEPFILANNYAFFQYSPQRTPDVPETIEMGTELDITFTIQDENINRESENTAMNNEYQWFKDDVLITDATNNTFTILNTQESDSGIYHCEITNTIVADLIIERADISLTVDSSLSINDNDIFKIKTYPNPVKNWLTLDVGIQGEFKTSLADVNGKIILEQTFNTSIASLDLSSLSSGLYVLKLFSEDRQITKKIIKQ
ncbi:T9SS type A sorting domain-containing protein [Psychroserpens luteus]|uniref:T9SS type A sorting domain-containing protein n=1 Tax=Psychroserpens luteus TaxID=1434066 RepID=A0ABW5ZPD2_9FLAO|nr:T9SS type A sorting domain-containing protein [Psychroserpens luteus]